MNPELALRATIWLSVLAWASSEVVRRAGSNRGAPARVLYAAGAVLLIAHTAIAFDVRHGWSHAAAFTDTAVRSAAVTGFASGAGLYLNYLFIAIWSGDAAWWWLRPQHYLRRSRGVDIGVFLFFLFMFVNGAIVFATSPMRIVGAAAVAAAVVARLAMREPQPARGHV